MTSHELAKRLLELPDLRVVFSITKDVNQPGEGDYVNHVDILPSCIPPWMGLDEGREIEDKNTFEYSGKLMAPCIHLRGLFYTDRHTKEELENQSKEVDSRVPDILKELEEAKLNYHHHNSDSQV